MFPRLIASTHESVKSLLFIVFIVIGVFTSRLIFFSFHFFLLLYKLLLDRLFLNYGCLRLLSFNLFLLNLRLQIFKQLLETIPVLVPRIHRVQTFSLRCLKILFKPSDHLLRSLNHDRVLHCDLAKKELSIAEFADATAWLRAIHIDFASGEDAILVKAVFTVTGAAELAKVHLVVILENEVATAYASIGSGLFLIRPAEDVDLFFVIDFVLILANLHDLFCTS